jgi:hypothetical protein
MNAKTPRFRSQIISKEKRKRSENYLESSRPTKHRLSQELWSSAADSGTGSETAEVDFNDGWLDVSSDSNIAIKIKLKMYIYV